jgi:hypothetical protein
MVDFVDLQKRVQKLCVLAILFGQLLDGHVKLSVFSSGFIQLFPQDGFLVHEFGSFVCNFLKFFVLFLESGDSKNISILSDLGQDFLSFQLMVLIFEMPESFGLFIQGLADLFEFAFFHGDFFFSLLERFHDFGFSFTGPLDDSLELIGSFGLIFFSNFLLHSGSVLELNVGFFIDSPEHFGGDFILFLDK